jgi:hypothetical protein
LASGKCDIFARHGPHRPGAYRETALQLNALNFSLMSGHKSLAERNRIESEIRAVTLAIEHFHPALQVEQNLSKEK